MALKGTLKDFGIADILQLIGHQTKTGILYLQGKGETVEIAFVEGNVVAATSKKRDARDFLGTMLVRAELTTQAQLDEALARQRTTLRRLGDILLEQKAITVEQLREVSTLQTTETIYKLFTWNSGTYEFVQQEVEYDKTVASPMRSEAILMEGFRIVDEWPMVRKRITSLAVTFERLKPLEGEEPGPPQAAGGDAIDSALDMAMGGVPAPERPSSPTNRAIGRKERIIYKLAEPNVTVSRVIDVARLGDFETCKALYNLVESGYLKVVAPTRAALASLESAGAFSTIREKLGSAVTQILVSALAAFAGIAVVRGAVYFLGHGSKAELEGEGVTESSSERFLSRSQMARLESAIEVYRLEKGEYPDSLERLVEARIVAERDLRYPWRARYYYRREGDTFVLLPPFD